MLKPSNGLNEVKEEVVKKKLAAYKKSLSQTQLTTIKKDSEELKKWQGAVDTKENLLKLPTLTRKDIKLKEEEIPTIEKIEQGTKVLSHPMFTNGITYYNLYFDTSNVPQNKVLYLKLLSSILGNVSTEKYNPMQISNKMMKYTGGMVFNSTAFKSNANSDEYVPKMSVCSNSLNSELPEALDLLGEIMNHSVFNDKLRMKGLIKTLRANYESMFVNQGNTLAINRTLSYLSSSGKYKDLNIIPYYNFLCDLDDNYESRVDEITTNLNDVSNIVFNKKGLVVSYTGDEAN